MPDNFIFMGFYFVLSKRTFLMRPFLRGTRRLVRAPPFAVYANSFLAAPNTRRVSRGRGTDNEHTTVPTLLMVGKVTQRTVQIDPEAAVGCPFFTALCKC